MFFFGDCIQWKNLCSIKKIIKYWIKKFVYSCWDFRSLWKNCNAGIHSMCTVWYGTSAGIHTKNYRQSERHSKICTFITITVYKISECLCKQSHVTDVDHVTCISTNELGPHKVGNPHKTRHIIRLNSCRCCWNLIRNSHFNDLVFLHLTLKIGRYSDLYAKYYSWRVTNIG